MEGKLLSVFGKQFVRQVSTTAQVCGKRNFKKFPIFNKRGSRAFKEAQTKKPHPEVPIHSKKQHTPLFSVDICILLFNFADYGVRPIGYRAGTSFTIVPEMIPEIVMPDLTNFNVSKIHLHSLPCSFHEIIFHSSTVEALCVLQGE